MTTKPQHQKRPWTGLFSAMVAYLSWGLTPIYFKALIQVPPFEIILHRIVWSLALLIPLLVVFRRWASFLTALASLRTVAILFCSATIVALNWFLFIYAINTDRILQTSLGYYINPLMNVVIGMVFLKERLRPMQGVAVVLAGVGVFYLTVYHGEFPGIALALATLFATYGLIRKVAPVESMEGLAIETLLLSIPALAILVYYHYHGTGAFWSIDARIDLLLIGCAFVTALPLLLFTVGARALQLTTMGFLQFIAPSCTFLLAVFVYNEPFQKAQVVTFVFIWSALAIFSLDASWHHYRENHPARNRSITQE